MTKLLAHYGIRDYRRASTRVTAAIVDATDAARLDLALGRPVLVVDSTDVDFDGKPLLTKRSRFAAERVEFLVENGLTWSSDRALPDDREAQLARNPVDRRYRHEDQQNQERNFLPFQHPDLFGKLKADSAGADDSDDGRRPRIRLEDSRAPDSATPE